MLENELLDRLRKGDNAAYKYVFSTYYEYLCNYIFKLSNDYSLSEDIVQETILTFWEKRERIVIRSSLKSYLFRSCHNHFLQHIRKRKVAFDFLDKIKWEELFNSYMENSPKEQEDYQLKIDRLHALINKLPPRCKEIFLKNKFEKKKYTEIADDMNISIKTVEAQMSKALHFLRQNAGTFLL